MLRRNIGVKKVYNAYCKAEEFLFSFLFAVMVALVFSSAIARGIGKPLAWSLDVAQLLLQRRRALSARTLRSATINSSVWICLPEKCR